MKWETHLCEFFEHLFDYLENPPLLKENELIWFKKVKVNKVDEKYFYVRLYNEL